MGSLDHHSKHARARMQKRAIQPLIRDLILDFGKSVRAGDSQKFYLDQEARRRLRGEIGAVAYRRLEDLLDVYVLLSDDGTTITVGHRLKPIRPTMSRPHNRRQRRSRHREERHCIN